MSGLQENNTEWIAYLDGLAVKSRPAYERTIRRYHELCTIEDIQPENVLSVCRFLNFIHFRTPKDGLEIEKYLDGTLPTEYMMTSSIWVLASHIKSYFVYCLRREITKEDPTIDTKMQQWEKDDTKTQAKEFEKSQMEAFLINVPKDDPDW